MLHFMDVLHARVCKVSRYPGLFSQFKSPKAILFLSGLIIQYMRSCPLNEYVLILACIYWYVHVVVWINMVQYRVTLTKQIMEIKI